MKKALVVMVALALVGAWATRSAHGFCGGWACSRTADVRYAVLTLVSTACLSAVILLLVFIIAEMVDKRRSAR